MQLNDSIPAPWAGILLPSGIPEGHGFLEHPPAAVPGVRQRFLAHAPVPAILEGHLPEERVGALRVRRAARSRNYSSSIKADIGLGTPRPCREQMLAVLPDLIPAPRPLPGLGAPRPPLSVPEVALRPGFDPVAAGHFLRVPYRMSSPPAFAESRAREFPLRPAMRCAAVPAQVSLGDAGPATSQIRHVPDSPPHLAFPQNISVNGRGLTVAGLHLPVDSKAAPFARYAIATPAPAEGRPPERLANLVFPRRISVNQEGLAATGLHLPVHTKVALFSRHAMAASAAAQSGLPERLANLVFPKRISFSVRGLTVADAHVGTNSRTATFAQHGIEPLSPAEARTRPAAVSSRSWVLSNRIALGKGPRVQLYPLAPVGAAWAKILPPQASGSSVLEGLRERIFSPRIKSNLRLRLGEPELITHQAVLPTAKLPLPLDFRWQRERKQWDRAARWKRRLDSVSLPTISSWPASSLLDVVAGTSLPGRN